MNETLKLSAESELIAQTVPFGRAHAIRRDALAAALGTSDRQMRRMLQQARDEGLIVLNDQDGNGYYQSADVADMKAAYRADKARALSILKRLKTMRRMLKDAGVEV